MELSVFLTNNLFQNVQSFFDSVFCFTGFVHWRGFCRDLSFGSIQIQQQNFAVCLCAFYRGRIDFAGNQYCDRFGNKLERVGSGILIIFIKTCGLLWQRAEDFWQIAGFVHKTMNSKEETNFQENYQDITFRGKREDEEIILLLRRHWLILLLEFFPLFLLLLFLLFFNLFSENMLVWLPDFVSADFFYLMDSFLFMFFWLIIFIVWLDYYLDVWIVTDQRIVNIEQKGLFFREISELEHSKIQDVTTEVHGIVPTLLKFGYVYIQTAAEKSRFVFKQVPDPVLVRTVIMKLQKRAIKEEKIEEGQLLRGKAS